MNRISSPPGDYVHFKSQVPLHKISVGSKQWRYYDFGPKAAPPLLCVPGIAGTADVYYKQIMFLSRKGYRVISIDIPRIWNHVEWVHAFEKFLDTINIHHVHLYGTSLGGFLVQVFAQYRPRRVKSLVLSNSFLETNKSSAGIPWTQIVSWSPSFLLKRYILIGIRDGPHEPFIADSVDFVVSQVETLSKEDVSSRLTLNINVASVGQLSLSDTCVTIMDTNDYSAIPQQQKDLVSERYPGARRAILKDGGDFPFLSRSDEVNLHLQLHMRRVGAEADAEESGVGVRQHHVSSLGVEADEPGLEVPTALEEALDGNAEGGSNDNSRGRRVTRDPSSGGGDFGEGSSNYYDDVELSGSDIEGLR